MAFGSSLFLFILFVIGLIAKNKTLYVAVLVLAAIKASGASDKPFVFLQDKGLQIGITVITIAVLVPIATGEIGFKQLVDAAKSYSAWIAVGAGLFVALIAKSGLDLLANDPHLTAALVLGTILAVSLFGGVAVGPLIGAGIAALLISMIKHFGG
ncbi:DUF441 domain-containing protein [Aureibacillus halotolerans]|uniref:UPF0756 membrane protein EV213_10888 n=1 Tax=Aureibacillus halotolerans TaxID=1508390 RepID=A0A4R6TZR9_9BACI|nr:DUF441 domain-containing protein [Aureibacillus halotolerans]TDQ39141.1 uncharacterized membrane protein (DUF441 family) [Aureibacillus halotolerans]